MYEDIYRLSHSRVDTVEEKHLSLYLQINMYIKMQWILSIKKKKKKYNEHMYLCIYLYMLLIICMSKSGCLILKDSIWIQKMYVLGSYLCYWSYTFNMLCFFFFFEILCTFPLIYYFYVYYLYIINNSWWYHRSLFSCVSYCILSGNIIEILLYLCKK